MTGSEYCTRVIEFAGIMSVSRRRKGKEEREGGGIIVGIFFFSYRCYWLSGMAFCQRVFYVHAYAYVCGWVGRYCTRAQYSTREYHTLCLSIGHRWKVI
ncbi:hypothetical protein HOY80DRAFT_959429 [Tuber brumale]|nr:hypothetical protein HOY80DRAFT_959429 [Tuber brumale]